MPLRTDEDIPPFGVIIKSCPCAANRGYCDWRFESGRRHTGTAIRRIRAGCPPLRGLRAFPRLPAITPATGCSHSCLRHNPTAGGRASIQSNTRPSTRKAARRNLAEIEIIHAAVSGPASGVVAVRAEEKLRPMVAANLSRCVSRRQTRPELLPAGANPFLPIASGAVFAGIIGGRQAGFQLLPPCRRGPPPVRTQSPACLSSSRPCAASALGTGSVSILVTTSPSCKGGLRGGPGTAGHPVDFRSLSFVPIDKPRAERDALRIVAHRAAGRGQRGQQFEPLLAAFYDQNDPVAWRPGFEPLPAPRPGP